MEQVKAYRRIDYLLVGLIIALTGFEFLFRASVFIQAGILVIVALYFFSEKKEFNYDFFLIAILLTIPFLLQASKYNLYDLILSNTISTFIQLLLCYMVLVIVKDRFHITVVNIMYFLALVSLIFYPTQFLDPVQEMIKSTIGSLIRPIGTADYPEGFVSNTLIFFTYMHNYGQIVLPDVVQRNCGAFWEPGMFAVFLNIALVMNLYINDTKLLSKKNLIIIIAIITTLSTTGIIVLFLIILSRFIFLNDHLKIVLSFPVIVGIAFVFYTYVWDLDFMGGKVESGIENRSNDRQSRFGAAVYHFNELKDFPLAGVSLSKGVEEQRLDISEREVSPNGISLVFFVYGIPVGVLYFILFFIGIERWLGQVGVRNKLLQAFFILVFLLLTFSQDMTGRLFYMLFLFFPIVYPKSQILQQAQVTHLNK